MTCPDRNVDRDDGRPDDQRVRIVIVVRHDGADPADRLPAALAGRPLGLLGPDGFTPARGFRVPWSVDPGGCVELSGVTLHVEPYCPLVGNALATHRGGGA